MTLVELAPQHKSGLALKSPVMAAAGCWGFADEYAGLVDFAPLGAFVTNPITWRPRRPARQQHAAPVPGGVLVHTGLPNPGLRRACDEYAGKWSRLPCAVILHLAVTNAADTDRAMLLLERLDVLAGVELGFRDDEDIATAAAAITAAAGSLLPVLVRTPFLRAVEFAQAAARAGAAAVTVAAPPRGALPGAADVRSHGRLYGPALFPQLLNLLPEVRAATPLPLVACGGIHTAEQARACLRAGATAIQLDSVVWTAPERVAEIVEEIVP